VDVVDDLTMKASACVSVTRAASTDAALLKHTAVIPAVILAEYVAVVDSLTMMATVFVSVTRAANMDATRLKLSDCVVPTKQQASCRDISFRSS
jgi:hypothetical protein